MGSAHIGNTPMLVLGIQVRCLAYCLAYCYRSAQGKKKLRGEWKLEDMQRAVNDVLTTGMSKKKASCLYHVPRGTLQRHVKKSLFRPGVEKRFGRRFALFVEQEEDLVKRLIDMESRLYGLTPEDIRRIVYRFCEQNGVEHQFNREKQLAGRKWLR